MKLFTVLLAILPLGAASSAHAETASGVLKDLQGKSVGTVELSDTPSGAVLVRLSATGLPAGSRAFHIHEKGECNAATKFESAGAHLSGGKSHGVLHADGPHTGDLPNIEVGKDGAAAYETFIAGEGNGGWLSAANVFDADGAAVVIHSKADDHRSQPAGDAGDRIACGVLSETQAPGRKG